MAPTEAGFDLRKQHLLLFGSLYLCVGIVVYIFVVDILLLLLLGLAIWYGQDLLTNYTRELVEPAGKYIYITGCDSGFGLEGAKALRDLGFGVIAGCFSDTSKGALELKKRPWVQKVEVVSLDVTNEASVLAAAKEVKDIVRDQGLWAVVNNAGINCVGPVELVSMEMFHRCAEVNLFGAVRVTKSVLPLIRQSKGRIINVTSERAFNPWKNSAPYCISKFGLEAFSACLRREMKEFNVKIITIAPGDFAGATSIVTQNMNEQIQEKLLQAHANLSMEDQNKYKKETITELDAKIQAAVRNSCTTCEPVVKAFIDAVHNKSPNKCYLVHGMKRQFWDPQIIMCRIRPFIPDSAVELVEKFLFAVLG